MENKHSKRKKNNMDKGTVSGKEKTGHLVNCEYKKVLYIDNLVQKA